MARVRRQPGCREALQQYPEVLTGVQQYQGQWAHVFGNDHPIHIEVGMGRGRFISTMAAEHSDINYLAVEVIEEMILAAVQKMTKRGGVPANLRLIWSDACNLSDIFAPGEIERIYLNFSDPWPKHRHRKRRLTHSNFLQQYARILAPGGEIHFKTDNQGLFEFSLNELSDHGWRLKNIRLDLYKSLPEDNVATEYENRYVRQGLPIYRLEAVRPDREPT